MEPNLYKRHYFINQHKNKHSAFADDQVITADSADNLQRGLSTLQNIAKILEWEKDQKNLRRLLF
jgi:hypothetical protein